MQNTIYKKTKESRELNVKKVLIISDFNLNDNSSFSHLRLFEFAKHLCSENDVNLYLPKGENKILSDNNSFNLIDGDEEKLEKLYKVSDVVIVNGEILGKLKFKVNSKIPIIFDGYDPFSIDKIYEKSKDAIRKNVFECDYFLCASEMQKNYWIGMLSVYNRVNPILYREDNKLRNIIDAIDVQYISKEASDFEENYVLCELDDETDIEYILNCFAGLKDVDLKIIFKDDEDLNIKFKNIIDKINSSSEYENIYLAKYKDNKERNSYIDKAKIILQICNDTLKSRFKPKGSLKDYIEKKKLIISSSFNYLPDGLENKDAIILINKKNHDDLKNIICDLINDNNLYKQYKENIGRFIDNQIDYFYKLKYIVNNVKISIDKDYAENKSKYKDKNAKSKLIFFKNMAQKGIKMIFRS